MPEYNYTFVTKFQTYKNYSFRQNQPKNNKYSTTRTFDGNNTPASNVRRINYLLTESEVFTGKSQTETLPLLPYRLASSTGQGRGIKRERSR